MSVEVVQLALRTIQPLILRALTISMPRIEAGRCQQRINKIIDHTVMGGKFMRSALCLDTYSALNLSASNKDLQMAAKMAVVIELMQAFFLTLDDMMDESVLRRGRPCWHTLPSIGLNAINDGLVLDCALDLVISETMSGHPNCSAMKDLVQMTKRKTVMGQMLDCTTCGIADLNWTRYVSIVEHKTSQYTFVLPIRMALLLSDHWCHLNQVDRMANRLGYFFQAQDDYLDCFGANDEMGKLGTDIKDGKCTWITCALSEKLSVNSSDMVQFEANFGRKVDDNVKNVQSLLVKYQIAQSFQQFQSEYSRSLLSDLEQFPIVPLRPVLISTVRAMMNRRR